MNLQNKHFYNFLLSKNSNFVSYAISKLHSTYSTKYNRKQINLSIISKFISSYLDNKKIILKKKHKVEILKGFRDFTNKRQK